MRALVVISPFAGLQVGQTITDAARIDEVLAGENAPHVVAAEHNIETAAEPTDTTIQEA